MNFDLGKWPEMVVVGEPVTREQANEILIRTMSRRGWNFCNDKSWTDEVNRVVGFRSESHLDDVESRLAALEYNYGVLDDLGVLELEYIYNSRVSSAYLFGAHGWLNWDGVITGNMSYNVGKWPEADELADEWKLVASTFPYLNLTVQFFSERGEDDGFRTPAFEIRVFDGEAVVNTHPDTVLASVGPGQALDFEGRRREKGVSLERFTEAYRQVAGKQ